MFLVYTTAIDMGICPNDNNYLYVKIQDIGPNAISRTAWGFFRQSLFEVLYKQPNVNDSGVESVVRGLMANIADIKQMFVGVERHLKRQKYSEFLC